MKNSILFGVGRIGKHICSNLIQLGIFPDYFSDNNTFKLYHQKN